MTQCNLFVVFVEEATQSSPKGLDGRHSPLPGQPGPLS